MQLNEEQSEALVLKAKTIKIRSHEDCEAAALYRKDLDAVVKIIEREDNPAIKWAHDHHTALIAARNAKTKRFTDADKVIKGMISDWLNAVESNKRRIAQEAEQKRLADIRAAEDEKIANASALEAAGYTEDAEAELAAPVEIAPSVQASASEVKIEGQRTMKVWKWRKSDESKIPDKWWLLDEKGLGEEARTYQEHACVPGVEFYYDLIPVRQ